MDIKPEFVNEIDQELKDNYNKFYELNHKYLENMEESHLKVIEYYAMDYLFWLIEDPNILNKDIDKNSVNGKDITKQIMVSKSKNNLIDEIKRKFDKDIQRNIFYKTKVFYNLYQFNKNYKKDIENLRNDLSNYIEEAINLYEKAYIDYPHIIPPDDWLEYQNKMRQEFENIPSPFVTENNTYYNYMKYMYNTYPEHFYDEIIKLSNNKLLHDGAEIYYILKNKIDIGSVDDIDKFLKIKKVSSKSLKKKKKNEQKLKKIKL